MPFFRIYHDLLHIRHNFPRICHNLFGSAVGFSEISLFALLTALLFMMVFSSPVTDTGPSA